MLEAHDLAVDRTQYLREREDDEMTISTAVALGRRPGPQSVAGTEVTDDYFSGARAEYLKQGASASQSSTPFYPGTPDELPLELQRMPTFDDAAPELLYGLDQANPNQSSEQLISPTPAYPPSYSSPARGPAGHARGPYGPGPMHRASPSQASVGSLPMSTYSAQPAELNQYGIARPESREGFAGADFSRRGNSYGDAWQSNSGRLVADRARTPTGRPQQPSRQGTLDQLGAAAGADPYVDFNGSTDYVPLDSGGASTDHLPTSRRR